MHFRKKLVIAITGTLCSGKGLVAKIFKSKGCDIDSFSSVIKDGLHSKGVEINRNNLQDEGNGLRKEFGTHVLAEKLLEKHKFSNNPLVIDGLRNVGELEYLKANSNCFIIGLDAPLEVRWAFTQKRKGEKDVVDFDTFVGLDARDKGYNEPLNGQQVGMCLAQADFLVYNDEEFDKLEDSKLYAQINEIYDEIVKKHR